VNKADEAVLQKLFADRLRAAITRAMLDGTAKRLLDQRQVLGR
jgi:hypothetical protein